ncbi:ParB/RepB/Spo0J family partition protein [Microbacterium enclense]|uniref:ParB/RepB/Spo0J family partition protein n=1 Tax=Microbacterium enclense TaxID=993073 RepID=UPI0021A6E6FC|nr:ParB/RepB/Spo0J family partition protein [Microbacterium enclense]MCT2085066.1 ParB/RepB/Spo0J family partition protein [Microbacterium enclense]
MTTQPAQIEHVALADVEIDTNVRRNVVLDKSFVSSIRNYGILQPPVGWRDDAGKVHVTIGQRRTLAAREIGLDPLPVIIKTQQDAEQARIVAQLAENEQRLSLDPADTAHAYAQLQFEFGVTTEQIARKTNSPKAKVQTALAVSQSVAASAAAASHPITLEQAAIYAEFDTDDAAIAKLNTAAAENPAQLEHVAQVLREERLDAEVRERLKAQILAAGADFADSYDTWTSAGAESITYLWRSDDESRKRITPDELDQFSNLMGRILSGWRGDENRGFSIVWGIRDWKAQGLASHSGAPASGVPLTDEQRAERKQKRLDKADMRAATIVRREWIGKLVAEATPAFIAGDALLWITHAAVSTRHALGYSQNPEKARLLTSAWLGLASTDHGYGQTTARDDLQTALVDNSRTAPRMLLAYAIALVEAAAGDEKHPWFGQGVDFAPYFEQLAAWGYTLADVEQRIVTNANQKGTK